MTNAPLDITMAHAQDTFLIKRLALARHLIFAVHILCCCACSIHAKMQCLSRRLQSLFSPFELQGRHMSEEYIQQICREVLRCKSSSYSIHFNTTVESNLIHT